MDCKGVFGGLSLTRRESAPLGLNKKLGTWDEWLPGSQSTPARTLCCHLRFLQQVELVPKFGDALRTQSTLNSFKKCKLHNVNYLAGLVTDFPDLSWSFQNIYI